MASYHPKIVSEEVYPSDATAKCGPCANKQKKVKASTNVRVGFTSYATDDSFGDFCVGHRKELGQLISGRIVLAEWPTIFSGDFWSDS